MLLDKNKYCILKEFTKGKEGIYGSFIAKRLSLNQKTVSNVLNSLEKENILQFRMEGKNKIYSLNKDISENKGILELIEIEKRVEFLKDNKQLENLFSELKKIAKGILIVFGSYAKKTNQKDSDLDLMAIGNIGDTSELEESFGIEINTLKITKNKFNKKENLIKEVVENHIILKGVEEFVDLIW